MKITFYDTHGFEREFFKKANEQYNFEIEFLETRLTAKTAFLATGSDVVCSFVNDKIDADCVKVLSEAHVNLIVLRSVGFNHVDVAAAHARNILVARVPEYSPYAVAEFAIGLLLTLNRKIHRAHARVRELNFSLDGLVGFDLHGKTVGIIGTGKIGHIMCQIMLGFGCKILAYDLKKKLNLENNSAVRYCDLETLCKNSDIISLHVPLTAATFHLINEQRIEEMKNGVFIVNTGRGALIDAKALIKGLKSEKIGGAALDVYEEEEEVFFHDLSDKMLKDDNLARLLTFPNVLVTSHQAFLTQEALNTIAQTTLKSVSEFQNTKSVSADKVVRINV